MYVCLCNGVTDREIREVAAAGCRALPELTMRTGCGATCGSCLDMAQQILDEVHAALDVPMLAESMLSGSAPSHSSPSDGTLPQRALSQAA